MVFRQIILFLGLVSLFSVSPPRTIPKPGIQRRYAFEHPQMGTIFRVVFFSEKDSAACEAIGRLVFARIDSLNGIFSDWLPESELNRLCQTAGTGKKVTVSKDLFDILALSKQFSRQSEGAFDVTIGPLTRLWRRSRTLKEMPDEKHLADALSKVGWQHLELFPRHRQVRLKKTGMALDLGGIAQGWTADDCLKLLKKQGIFSALVDAGGDIALGDAPPGETGWAIQTPRMEGGDTTLLLQHCGITTSGATYRYLELEGKRYSHIVNPRTGMALTHRIVVTTLAKNATIADAWATAISVLGDQSQETCQVQPEKLRYWYSILPL